MPKAPNKNGTHYCSTTPPKIVSILEDARLAREGGAGYRLRIHYGDTATGRLWGDTDEGFIGRSTGKMKIPLILPLRSSTGGGGILVNSIVKIEHANKKNGGVLYDIAAP